EKRHVLRFEVSGATMALFRDAQAALMREAGESLSDDQMLELLARLALGGPKDDGRASYQVSIATCPSCKRVHQGEVEVDPITVEMAACDAQHVDGAHVGTRATQTIPPSTRRLIRQRSGGRCE